MKIRLKDQGRGLWRGVCPQCNALVLVGAKFVNPANPEVECLKCKEASNA